MKKGLVLIAVVCILSMKAPAYAQSSGDVLRHAADCNDAYNATNDSSAYLRCMAGVVDELDRLSNDDTTGASSAPLTHEEMVRMEAQDQYTMCEFHAKNYDEKDACTAAYDKATGAAPDHSLVKYAQCVERATSATIAGCMALRPTPTPSNHSQPTNEAEADSDIVPVPQVIVVSPQLVRKECKQRAHSRGDRKQCDANYRVAMSQ